MKQYRWKDLRLLFLLHFLGVSTNKSKELVSIFYRKFNGQSLKVCCPRGVFNGRSTRSWVNWLDGWNLDSIESLHVLFLRWGFIISSSLFHQVVIFSCMTGKILIISCLDIRLLITKIIITITVKEEEENRKESASCSCILWLKYPV